MTRAPARIEQDDAIDRPASSRIRASENAIPRSIAWLRLNLLKNIRSMRETGAVEKKRRLALWTIDFIWLFHRHGEGVCSGVCSGGQQPLFIRIGIAARNGDTFAIGQQAILSSLPGRRRIRAMLRHGI